MTSLRKVISSSVFCIFMLGSMTSNVFAQATENSESESVPATAPVSESLGFTGWAVGLNLTYVTLDEEAATKQRVGDDAFSLDVFASYYPAPSYAATIGVGLLQFDDEASFSQTVVVTDVFGSETQAANSDASGMLVYGELNYLANTSALPVKLKAGVGFGAIVSADRSIENCQDCREEDIDLSGGAYATAAAYRGFSDDKYHIGLSAKQYFGGDIKNNVSLTFEYRN